MSDKLSLLFPKAGFGGILLTAFLCAVMANDTLFKPTFRTLEHAYFVIKLFTNKLFASIDN
jgi:hypothetical protein